MQKWNLHKKLGKKHCYWFCFVLAGTTGIFRTGMQTSTIIPLFHLRSNFGVFWPFWQISAKIQISVGTRFWLRKKKKKNLTFFFFFLVTDPSSSCFLFLLLLLLLGFRPFFFFFFWWVSDLSSSFLLFLIFSSGGSCYQFAFSFLFVMFLPVHTFLFCHLCFTIWIFSLFCFCEPHVTNNKNEYSSLNPLPLFQLLILTSSFFLFVSLLLCFKFFICSVFAGLHFSLLSLVFYNLNFSLFCFCEPHMTNNKNECSSLNPLPLFQLLILTSNFFFLLLYFINDWTDTCYYYYYY